jgi:curved DNA-binding protein CbpA
MIKTNYRQLAKKFHPDTFTGSKDVSQRMMCDLNEAMRILSEAHARPFLEEKPVSPFHNFEDFENAGINFKAAKNKKDAHYLGDEINNAMGSGKYSSDRRVEKTFKKFSEFNPELSQLKARLAKLSVPLAQAFMAQVSETQEQSKASDVFKRFRDSFLIKYFGSSIIIQLLAEYLLNKGKKSEREKAMRLNKSIKLNGMPRDAKAFVRDFMKKHNIKESEVYGKKPKSF